MQNELERLEPTVPLLNVLLVRADTGEPGGGARQFLAARFPDDSRLKRKEVLSAYPELWTTVVIRAMSEVYDYPDWGSLYARLYGEHVPDPHFTASVEKDGSPRGYGGEGRYHRALRCWVMNHPDRIHTRFRRCRTKTEENLLSGDRVDVVYYTYGEILPIEVKSRVSSWEDLQRGIYQCVKYRAVLKAQERGRRTVRSLLVTECDLPSDLARLAKKLDVPHFCVGLRRL